MGQSWQRHGVLPISLWRHEIAGTPYEAVAATTASGSDDPTSNTAPAPAQRRRRRTREDVEQRICESARQLFAERGYAATTTREIARLADVSETLLFRYYGDKSGLFNEVVIAPFNALMTDFLALNQNPPEQFSREAETRLFTRRVFELFEGNEEMFHALLAGPKMQENGEAAPGLSGLTPFFRQSVDQVQERYAQAGVSPPFDLNIAVRIGFGMIAASVILRDALFPAPPPDREAVIDVLEQLVAHSLMGPSSD